MEQNIAFILIINNSPGPRPSKGTCEHPVTVNVRKDCLS